MCAVVKIVVLLFQLLQFHIGGGAAELISTAPVREGVRRPDECAQPGVALVDAPPEAETRVALVDGPPEAERDCVAPARRGLP